MAEREIATVLGGLRTKPLTCGNFAKNSRVRSSGISAEPTFAGPMNQGSR